MNPFVSKVANYLSWIVATMLVLLPFHAFLTIWLSTLLGHYTALRLWKEFLLVILVLGSSFILIKDASLRKKVTSSLLARLIILYIFLTVSCGIVAYILDEVTLKALGYGLIIDLRFLIFFLAVWIIATPLQKLDASQSDHRLLRSGFGTGQSKLKQWWPKLLLIPAALVILIGLLQRIILPYDFLKHFGYSSNTIYPYATINHNTNYSRIMSTLRGPNPLGAYLILILTALKALLINSKRKRGIWSIFAVVALLVLVFSYSRSAWIGSMLSLLFLGWISLERSQIKRVLLPAVAALLIAAAMFAAVFRHNVTFENLFFHTQNNSTIKTTSDQGHVSAFKSGMDDLINEPLGRGVGTAGPASVYNDNKVRIAENYYLQIAQEIGWAGLILFIAINYLIACELWLKRQETLARILLAALLGITFVNMLSHAWADDTLSYIWWGLAGIALAPIISSRQKAHGKNHKAKS
jgi:hypothetical protein